MVRDVPLHGRPESSFYADNGTGVAAEGGPDCEVCGASEVGYHHEDYCDGPPRCEVITIRGSRNPDSAAYGPDEQCENDAVAGQTVCAEHAYVIDEPPAVQQRPLNWDLLPQNPPVLIRSDERQEVADDEHAAERYACREHDECVLRDGHTGPPALVREYWFGPPPFEDDPNYHYYAETKD